VRDIEVIFERFLHFLEQTQEKRLLNIRFLLLVFPGEDQKNLRSGLLIGRVQGQNSEPVANLLLKALFKRIRKDYKDRAPGLEKGQDRGVIMVLSSDVSYGKEEFSKNRL